MAKYDEAKEIYFKHNGNYFFMDRGDESLEKYKYFNVPKELEQEWDAEIKQKLVLKIEKEKNMQYFEIYCDNLLSISADTRSIEDVDVKGLLFVYNTFVKKRNTLDTFTSILLIERIFFDVYYKRFKKADIITTSRIMKESLEFLKSLLEKPITISKDYTFPLGKSTDNDLKIRIQENIKEYTKIYDQTVLEMLNTK
jgi:hypothetical protein